MRNSKPWRGRVQSNTGLTMPLDSPSRRPLCGLARGSGRSVDPRLKPWLKPLVETVVETGGKDLIVAPRRRSRLSFHVDMGRGSIVTSGRNGRVALHGTWTPVSTEGSRCLRASLHLFRPLRGLIQGWVPSVDPRLKPRLKPGAKISSSLRDGMVGVWFGRTATPRTSFVAPSRHGHEFKIEGALVVMLQRGPDFSERLFHVAADPDVEVLIRHR